MVKRVELENSGILFFPESLPHYPNLRRRDKEEGSSQEGPKRVNLS